MKKLIYLFLLGLFSLNVSASLPIVKAIKHGDLDRVEQLVEEGADLNILIRRKYKDYTETLLHRAIYEEQPEILQFLIDKFKERGINIDKMGTCGESALMYTCSVGHKVKYAKILIKSGADINFDNGDGVTPFICAVFAWGPIKNRLKCCKLLKKSGAKLSLRFLDLDEVLEYGEDSEIWDFAKKNMSLNSKIKLFLCKLKTLLYKVLPDGDDSN